MYSAFEDCSGHDGDLHVPFLINHPTWQGRPFMPIDCVAISFLPLADWWVSFSSVAPAPRLEQIGDKHSKHMQDR
jgi:hypothetical protein